MSRPIWTLLLTWWACTAKGDPPKALRAGRVLTSLNSTRTVLTNVTVTTTDLNERLKNGESDATWVLTSSFVVLTMQSGFGLLESGTVDDRFAVNIMMKNVVDVLFGGLSYWMIGYGISYGESVHGIFGASDFFASSRQSLHQMTLSSHTVVDQYSHYIFQFTFAATATTIVSGCVAGRLKFVVYIMFSFINTIQYCFPAHWVFCEEGWLFKFGFYDYAGDAPVHLVGGITGAVAAWMVGPRDGRFDKTRADEFGLANPLNCIFGLFMLWWGWLGFNCGSTFGVTGDKWLVASRVAVTTINASIGGGIFGICSSAYSNHGKVKVDDMVNSILAALVSITAGCAAMSPGCALLVGSIGAGVAQVTNVAMLHYRLLDDPVGAVGVHASAGLWGLLCVGLFADSTLLGGPKHDGVFLGGGLRLLGIQLVGIVVVLAWTFITSLLIFAVFDRVFGLRVPLEAEAVGADFTEHGIIPKTSASAVGSGRFPPEIEALLHEEFKRWLEHNANKDGLPSALLLATAKAGGKHDQGTDDKVTSLHSSEFSGVAKDGLPSALLLATAKAGGKHDQGTDEKVTSLHSSEFSGVATTTL